MFYAEACDTRRIFMHSGPLFDQVRNASTIVILAARSTNFVTCRICDCWMGARRRKTRVAPNKYSYKDNYSYKTDLRDSIF